MGYKLKSLSLDGGLSMREKACEKYVCRSCGKKMISANFVTGICIQVFVSHDKDCTLFMGNAFEKTCQVTCQTCQYYDETSQCMFEGQMDSRMSQVRINDLAEDAV